MTTRPWDAEIEIDAAQAAALVARASPRFAGARVAPFGAGWDNAAFLVEDGAGVRFVARFPRKAPAVDLLENEARALPALSGRLPLAVPAPARFVVDGFPWPFVMYPLLPGRTACGAALDDAARVAAAPALGRFLAALHAIPVDDGALRALPGDVLARTDFGARRATFLGRVEALARAGVVDDVDALRAVYDDGPGGPTPSRVAIVHGDLYARHLLVDDVGRIAAVIDWGDVHKGDPALDLQIAWLFLPAVAREAFFAAYGPVDDGAARTARRRALFHAVATAWFAGETGDAALAAESRCALAHVLQPMSSPS